MTDPKPERRSQKRIKVRVPVSIKCEEGKVQSAGYTRDLSSGGVFFYTDSQIGEGSELEIVLVLPPELTNGEKRWVCCQALVARIENQGNGREFGLAAVIRRLEVLPEMTG
jgi:c-di-GMP-binding flagellar brake protein YcgR